MARMRRTARRSMVALLLCACSTTGADEAEIGDETSSPVCGEGRRPADAPPDETVLVPVIEHAQWVQIAEDVDPFADHRPGEIDRGPTGWRVDFDGFEVETIGCNYMAARQPTLVELCAGDQLHFDFQPFNLVASEPAQAHAAVLLGDQALLDYTVDVDSEGVVPARKWDEMIEVVDDLAVGSPADLHIHNHGWNNYKLLDISLALPAPRESSR